jgi:hypothetical protein
VAAVSTRSATAQYQHCFVASRPLEIGTSALGHPLQNARRAVGSEMRWPAIFTVGSKTRLKPSRRRDHRARQ